MADIGLYVFGTSILWGQGHNDDKKIHTRIKQWLERKHGAPSEPARSRAPRHAGRSSLRRFDLGVQYRWTSTPLVNRGAERPQTERPRLPLGQFAVEAVQRQHLGPSNQPSQRSRPV